MKQMLDLRSVRFLVVDGNPHMREITISILRVLGAREIKSADEGKNAFAIHKSFNADIIITDWMMEPHDGIAFTRIVRNGKDSPNPMVPIIMLTAYSEKTRVNQARDAGVTEFVVKPVSPKALYLRIAEVILNPRQFVRTSTFYGPDRHRHDDGFFMGTGRRKTDQDGSSENIFSQHDDEPAVNNLINN